MASVPIRYSRVLPHGRDECYAWLTDYRDDDPTLTTAVQRARRVLERTPERVVMEGQIAILGNEGSGRFEVRLQPPGRYEAHILEGPGRKSVYTYELTPLGAARTRLDVVYNIRARRLHKRLLVWLLSPFIKRELAQMWDGFVREMAKDLSVADAPPAPPQAAPE